MQLDISDVNTLLKIAYMQGELIKQYQAEIKMLREQHDPDTDESGIWSGGHASVGGDTSDGG